MNEALTAIGANALVGASCFLLFGFLWIIFRMAFDLIAGENP